MSDRAILAPGYARCLAGYYRAHAAFLDADVACLLDPANEAKRHERLAFLDDRYQWQQAMREQRAALWVAHG